MNGSTTHSKRKGEGSNESYNAFSKSSTPDQGTWASQFNKLNAEHACACLTQLSSKAPSAADVDGPGSGASGVNRTLIVQHPSLQHKCPYASSCARPRDDCNIERSGAQSKSDDILSSTEAIKTLADAWSATVESKFRLGTV